MFASASQFSDQNVELFRTTVLSVTGANVNKKPEVQGYMNVVHNQAEDVKNNLTFGITRLVPGAELDRAHLMKNVVNKLLLPYYRVNNPQSNNFISNYNCFNFFSASNETTASCLIYPNDKVSSSTGEVTASWYSLNDRFSFDFFVKPKKDLKSLTYKPGTILHLSRSYCIALHSGSSKDENGFADKFMISFGFDANEQPPSSLSPAITVPTTWWTTDNALEADEWSHVCITWPGHLVNEGSGSIYVNAVLNNTFSHDSSALNLGVFDEANDIMPNAFVVGNYWQGNNTDPGEYTKNFFGPDTAQREGLIELTGIEPLQPFYDFSFFNEPLLNAELHDLKVYERYLTKDDVAISRKEGPSKSNGLLSGLKFYLPGFFTEESPYRGDAFGGELVTPFFTRTTSTNTPFAGRMAFGVGGHYINLENYVRDFVTGHNPRLWALSASVITDQSQAPRPCNEILYTTGSVVKRLYTVLPCDDGAYMPNFGLLSAMSGSKFVNDMGNKDLGHVTMNDIVPATMDARSIVVSGSLLDSVVGATPENIYGISTDNLAILNRTRDNSSAQVVLFNISNLFYGMQIKPKSFMMRDKSISGSLGNMGSVTLKDDGMGNLYREDSKKKGSGPSWTTVGSIFYNEGVVELRYPQLYFFGEQQFEMEFQGINNIHTYTINCMAQPLMQTSSSNPSYLPLPADDSSTRVLLANNDDQKFTWITQVLIHDENLNVIARTSTAQPIQKRSSDKMLFKVKMDY